MAVKLVVGDGANARKLILPALDCVIVEATATKMHVGKQNYLTLTSS